VNPPPVHALSRRGMVANLHGYPVYGDYAQAVPGRAVVDAVASGEVDLAIVWGPLAGYLAGLEPVPLALSPVRPLVDRPMLPMLFDIAVGVRRGDRELRQALDAALERNRNAIDAILRQYGVPRLPLAIPVTATAAEARP
jgi:mxaJ protein